MTPERRQYLIDHQEVPDAAEIFDGWHWCVQEDAIRLVGPGDPELAACCCPKPQRSPQPVVMLQGSGSQVARYGYDNVGQRLVVEFRGGGRYSYTGVTLDTFREMQAASSLGKFMAANIKGFYPVTKEA